MPRTAASEPAAKAAGYPGTNPAPQFPAAPLTAPAAAQTQKSSWWQNLVKPTDEAMLFEQGRAQLAAGNNRTAARTLNGLIKNYPASPRREEAMWLRATALFNLEDYYAAYEQCEELLAQYAGSPHYRDALVKEVQIADIYFGPTRRKVLGIPLTSGDTEAVEILRKVYEHQPAGDLADDVILRIADHFWTQGNWQEAEDYYDRYCREFPNGESARRAELRRAKCAIERCRGSRYDTACLQLAYDRLRDFQQKFPQEAEKEGVGTLMAQVRDMQAAGLYETAAHYMRAHQPEAAAFCVERLVERFPDSPWCQEARKLVANASLRQEPKP
jgi:outer membrane assembly lipoprotein YfiO